MENNIYDKLQVAYELLKNTTNIYLKSEIENYIKAVELNRLTENNTLDIRLEYILNEKFDITGWMLYEIPIDYAYCFFNESTKESFDLDLFDGVVTPAYINENACERDAKSIQEAIDNFVQ